MYRVLRSCSPREEETIDRLRVNIFNHSRLLDLAAIVVEQQKMPHTEVATMHCILYSENDVSTRELEDVRYVTVFSISISPLLCSVLLSIGYTVR